MSRFLPTRRTVLRAIEDLRGTLRRPPAMRPGSVSWVPATPGACRACTEEGPRFRPAREADPEGAPLPLCARTLAEIVVATRLPAGAHLESILETVERWMQPSAEEPVDPLHALGRMTSAAGPPVGDQPDPAPSRAACAVCGRGADAVSRLVMVDDDGGLCGDCAADASPVLPPEIVAEAARIESEDAAAELADLERVRSLSGNAAVRTNPTMALSVVRLLDVSDPSFRERLHAMVRLLDDRPD